MGELVLAAKVPHIPGLLETNHDGAEFSGRDIVGALCEVGIRARALDVDCFIVFDGNWTTHFSYHVNGDQDHAAILSSTCDRSKRTISHSCSGNPALAALIVAAGQDEGIDVMCLAQGARPPGDGTMVPMHLIDPKARAAVVPVAIPASASSDVHRRFGEAVSRAISASDLRVAILASGALSRGASHAGSSDVDPWSIRPSQFNYRMDICVLDLWKNGEFKAFAELLPDYAAHADPMAAMGDLQMLFGALGSMRYQGPAEPLCAYLAYNGAGQTVFDFHI